MAAKRSIEFFFPSSAEALGHITAKEGFWSVGFRETTNGRLGTVGTISVHQAIPTLRAFLLGEETFGAIVNHQPNSNGLWPEDGLGRRDSK